MNDKDKNKFVESLYDNLLVMDWLVAEAYSDKIEVKFPLMVMLAKMRVFPSLFMNLENRTLFKHVAVMFKDSELFAVGYQSYFSFLEKIVKLDEPRLTNFFVSELARLSELGDQQALKKCRELFKRISLEALDNKSAEILNIISITLKSKIKEEKPKTYKTSDNRLLANFEKMLG